MASNLRRLTIVSGIYVVVVSSVYIVFFGVSFAFVFGLLIGSALAILKAMMWGNLPLLLARSAGRRMGKAILISIGVQLFTGIFLFIAAWLNTRFFFGLAAGLTATVAGVFTYLKEAKYG